LYETTPDITQTAVAESIGVSRQAVQKRAKKEGWLKCSPVVTELECAKPTSGSKLGIRTPENIAEIINTFALTGNKATACRIVGIDDATLYRWCQKEPELAMTMTQARDQHLLGQYRKIADAKDWKAAKEILSRAPETKEVWGEVQKEGPTIVLNIQRD
jgi:hypothetical protein